MGINRKAQGLRERRNREREEKYREVKLRIEREGDRERRKSEIRPLKEGK